RIGYRFLGSVLPLSDPVVETFSVTRAEPSTGTALVDARPTPPVVVRSRSQIWRWVAGVLLLAAVSTAFLYRAGAMRHAASTSVQWLSASQATPLTTYVGSEQYPSFSPDGKEIAFAWDGPALGGMHIYTISANGRDLKQISQGSFSDYAPVWSPDGSTVAFMRESDAHTKELWSVRADGSEARKIADFGRITRYEHPLAWTRDPRWIVAAGRPSGEGPS